MAAFLTPLLPTPRRRTRHSRAAVCTATPPSTQTAAAAAAANEVPIPPVVFVLGGPGSGKGTQCGKLMEEFNVAQVCVGDLLRREAASGSAVGSSVAEIMQRGEIVPGHITMSLLRAELSSLAGACGAVLVDGFPRAMDQATDFEKLVTKCCMVLFFECTEKEMIRRILKRGETSGRADDCEQVVRKRLKTFVEKTMPVVEYFKARGIVKAVDSTIGDENDVYVLTKPIFEHLLSE